MSGDPNTLKVKCEGVERINQSEEKAPSKRFTGKDTILERYYRGPRASEPRDPPCLQCQLHKTFTLFKEDGRSSWPAQQGFSSSTHYNNHGIA